MPMAISFTRVMSASEVGALGWSKISCRCWSSRHCIAGTEAPTPRGSNETTV
jgi:hypothetical protein